VDFEQLYGSELDRELGTSDRDQRFTTERRKAAINAAQLEWVERTECLQREVSLTLVSGTQEYDLEAEVTNFLSLAKEGVSIAITSGTSVRYLEGNDLEVTTVDRLNTEYRGWRAEPAGTPRKVYTRREVGLIKLGFYPAPSFTTETWVALVHAVIQPAEMTLDADIPFTYSGNPIASLAPYHRALPHFAAYDLEKFRKDDARGTQKLQLFEQYVTRYEAKQKPKGGQKVRLAVAYRGARRGDGDVNIGRGADPSGWVQGGGWTQ
jgi:hypothetical protein